MNDQFAYSFSKAATGSPIKFVWNGKNFLTLTEAKTISQQLNKAIEQAKPKTTAKKAKKNGRR